MEKVSRARLGEGEWKRGLGCGGGDPVISSENWAQCSCHVPSVG